MLTTNVKLLKPSSFHKLHLRLCSKNAGKDGEGDEEKRVDSSLLVPVIVLFLFFWMVFVCQFGSWFVPVFDFVLFSFVFCFFLFFVFFSYPRNFGPD